MEDTFGFQIPESVIRTVVFTKLKSIAQHERGNFNFDSSISSDFQGMEKELEGKELVNQHIFSNLKKFVATKEKRELSKEDEGELFDNFNQFLFDNGSTDKYTNHISSFIIKNETDYEFVKNLNSIREGLILYQGIKYTADIEELGEWNHDLVIYLNTEYLFSALGYDGVLLQEIFLDFHRLVQEINTSGKRKKISLKYFSETKEEIESYFITAESILKKHKKLWPWKIAMKTLVESCKTPSDIITRKVEFYAELDRLGIEFQEFNYDANEYKTFNVEDKDVVEELKKVSTTNRRQFDEDSCYDFFRMFTKVNYFRNGKNNKPFEKIGHIFISNSSFAKYLGHNNKVKFKDSDTSFAKDIDFVTTRFWIKLKKGFSEKTEYPKSFNVLTKAKIIISSQINYSLSKEFDKLVKETNEGKLTKEIALQRSYALREKPSLPLDINSNNIEKTFDFLNNESYLDNIFREEERKNELLKETQEENERLKTELDRRDKIEKGREEEKRKKLEQKKLEEKQNRHEENIAEYNRKMDQYSELKWTNKSKEIKWHFWRYCIFIIGAIAIIFILVLLRDQVLGLLNFQITEESKYIYSGLIIVLGFLATTIRSFFDTKNILAGLKLITNRNFRNTFKKNIIKESKERYRKEHAEPMME